MCRDSQFVALMYTILKFAITSKKDYSEKFVGTIILNKAKDTMGSKPMREMRFQSYYR